MTADWHGTPDGPVWGVKARVLPKGEYDAEDEKNRSSQGVIKFNSLNKLKRQLRLEEALRL